MTEDLDRAAPFARVWPASATTLRPRAERVLAEVRAAIWRAYRDHHGAFASQREEAVARFTIEAGTDACFHVALGAEADRLERADRAAQEDASAFLLSVIPTHLENAFQALASDVTHGAAARAALVNLRAIQDTGRAHRQAAHSRALRTLESAGRARRTRGGPPGPL